MQMRKVKFGMIGMGLVAISAIMASPSAFAAATPLAKACKTDLQKSGCTGTTDSELHECLEQHEDHKKPNDGFTKTCQKAHEAFESAHGKQESDEKHES
jgi:hypothetical protein